MHDVLDGLELQDGVLEGGAVGEVHVEDGGHALGVVLVVGQGLLVEGKQ